MAEANESAPIIKRVKKVAGHGHHGGAWKVAYADFVTAMMAFFLLLWLLNATTEEQKRAISNYFAPSSVSTSKSGAGGVLGGKTFSEQGAMPGMGGAPAVMLGMPPPTFGDPDAEEPEDAEPGVPVAGGPAQEGKAADLAEEELKKAAERAEQKEFERTAAALRETIETSPELARLKDSLIVEQTAEGLRIQMVDQDKFAMFPIGSSRMDPGARRLLQQIADAIRLLPNRISVSGHTDATPYVTDRGYSNWELSSDRANASRRVLIELGVGENRITQVVGRADTEPLIPEEPFSPRNRRISITLLRQANS